MTSDEIQHRIKSIKQAFLNDKTEQGPVIAAQTTPLWEIAYQLALLNEDRMAGYRTALEEHESNLEQLNARTKFLEGRLAAPVGTDSSDEVRGDRCAECSHVHQQSSHCGAPIRLWKGYDPNMATWDECGCFSDPHHATVTDTRTTRPDPQTALVPPKE